MRIGARSSDAMSTEDIDPDDDGLDDESHAFQSDACFMHSVHP